MDRVKEFAQGEIWMGLACGDCSLTFLHPKALNQVRIADAELLFCPRCGQHLATVLDAQEMPLAKSA